MNDSFRLSLGRSLRAALLLVACGGAQAQTPPPKSVDYIVAVVNNELVTQLEINQRLARVREDAARARAKLPPEDELRREITQSLIDERVQITHAREVGQKVDEPELDRAVANIATANQLPSIDVLRERLKADGVDYGRFRSNLRDQIMTERVREREVQARVRISDADIDAWLAARKASQGSAVELNIAQILVPVPEGASVAEVAQRRARMDAAVARVRAGEDFAKVAQDVSEDSNRQRGGEIGARTTDRLPDLFVEAVKNLAPGAVVAEPLRSAAGFHLVKLISRSDPDVLTITQTRARHILLRPSVRLTAEAARRRLAEMRDQILAGRRKFEDLAREFSEDGSAPNGGDLGWATPGMFVPEFEQAMNALLPGAMSDPLVSRFGVHLIQVTDRRQVPQDPRQAREQARNALREQKYEGALEEWVRELRNQAYIEMREPPL